MQDHYCRHKIIDTQNNYILVWLLKGVQGKKLTQDDFIGWPLQPSLLLCTISSKLPSQVTHPVILLPVQQGSTGNLPASLPEKQTGQ